MANAPLPLVYIWRYRIKPVRRGDFLAAYDKQGDWVKLFSCDDNYLGTELLQDVDDADCYLSIDRWTSKSARDDFRARYAGEFSALDARCEAFSIEETFIGDFLAPGD